MKLLVVYMGNSGKYINSFLSIESEDNKLTEDLVIDIIEDLKRRKGFETVLILNIIKLEG